MDCRVDVSLDTQAYYYATQLTSRLGHCFLSVHKHYEPREIRRLIASDSLRKIPRKTCAIHKSTGPIAP